MNIDNLYFSFEPLPTPGALALFGVAASRDGIDGMSELAKGASGGQSNQGLLLQHGDGRWPGGHRGTLLLGLSIAGSA